MWKNKKNRVGSPGPAEGMAQGDQFALRPRKGSGVRAPGPTTQGRGTGLKTRESMKAKM